MYEADYVQHAELTNVQKRCELVLLDRWSLDHHLDNYFCWRRLASSLISLGTTLGHRCHQLPDYPPNLVTHPRSLRSFSIFW